MAGYYSVWRFSRTTLAILLATACSAQLALGQYTFVQDTDSVGDWSDVANWDTDNDPGTPNTTYPNGIGVTAQINQPIKSGVGGYTLDMPATDVTVGTAHHRQHGRRLRHEDYHGQSWRPADFRR